MFGFVFFGFGFRVSFFGFGWLVQLFGFKVRGSGVNAIPYGTHMYKAIGSVQFVHKCSQMFTNVHKIFTNYAQNTENALCVMPYVPPKCSQMFTNVHKMFTNVHKMLNHMAHICTRV